MIVQLGVMHQSTKTRAKHYLFVLFIENLSLAMIYPVIPAAIFASSQNRSEAIFYSTINLVFFPLAYMLGTLYAGWRLDKIGRRPLLLSSISINVLGLALLLQPVFNPLLLLSRTLSGAGQACTSVIQANITDISPPETRPHYFGLSNAAIACSFITGLLMAGLLTWRLHNFQILFVLSFICSLGGLIYAYFLCPETFTTGKSQQDQSRALSKMSLGSSLIKSLNNAATLFRGSNAGGMWLLFSFNFTNFGIFAFWSLYTKNRFDWSVTTISGSLLLMAITAAVAQGLVLPACLKWLGARRLLHTSIGSTIVYLLLLGTCSNGQVFAMLPLLNIIGFTGSSLLQGKLSERTPAESQGLLTSTFGLLTGFGTLLSVLLSGSLTWWLTVYPSAGTSLDGLPFFVLALFLCLCWLTIARSFSFECLS